MIWGLDIQIKMIFQKFSFILSKRFLSSLLRFGTNDSLWRIDSTSFALGSFLLFQVVFYFFNTKEPHLSPPDLSNLPDFFKAVK